MPGASQITTAPHTMGCSSSTHSSCRARQVPKSAQDKLPAGPVGRPHTTTAAAPSCEVGRQGSRHQLGGELSRVAPRRRRHDCLPQMRECNGRGDGALWGDYSVAKNRERQGSSWGVERHGEAVPCLVVRVVENVVETLGEGREGRRGKPWPPLQQRPPRLQVAGATGCPPRHAIARRGPPRARGRRRAGGHATVVNPSTCGDHGHTEMRR